MILDGRKTQTRRLWKKGRVKVGMIHQCYTRPAWLKVDPGTPFARVQILAVRQEQLGAITPEDALREGYQTREDYFEAFARINYRGPSAGPVIVRSFYEQLVWVVDFQRVAQAENP